MASMYSASVNLFIGSTYIYYAQDHQPFNLAYCTCLWAKHAMLRLSTVTQETGGFCTDSLL